MRDYQPINIETFLNHVALFNSLCPEEITKITRGTREIRCEKGDTLFHRGDVCTGFHILVFGQVKLSFTSEQGVEKVVEVIQQGQSFGEAIMFLEKPYVVSAQALSSCLLLHVSKSVILDELECDHGFVRKMLAGMAMRMHQLMLDVEGYCLHSGKQRIIAYLMHELLESQLHDENVVLELQLNKGVIASRLNLTQEHFSRILHELSDLGIIKVEGKRILVPSVERLHKHQST
ncbi:MAG: Crp/Fnr family transcriptional regulator [Pseudomonadota bacterium]